MEALLPAPNYDLNDEPAPKLPRRKIKRKRNRDRMNMSLDFRHMVNDRNAKRSPRVVSVAPKTPKKVKVKKAKRLAEASLK